MDVYGVYVMIGSGLCNTRVQQLNILQATAGVCNDDYVTHLNNIALDGLIVTNPYHHDCRLPKHNSGAMSCGVMRQWLCNGNNIVKYWL